MELKTKMDKIKDCPTHFHRQMVYHFIQHCEQLYQVVKQGIMENYGLPDDPNKDKDDDEEEELKVGPFSIFTYMNMKYIIGAKKWGDSVCLTLIASMWSARITVVLSRTLGQLKFRHDMPLEQADLIIVFNNNEQTGHYSGVIRSNQNIMMAGDLKCSKNYDISKDVKQGC